MSDSTFFTGCVEIHFDGTTLDRPGDVPAEIGVDDSLGTDAPLYPSEEGYIIDRHHDGVYLVSGKMPNTTGNEVSTNWPPDVVFPAQTNRQFASLVDDQLYCYPCQVAAADPDIHILSVEKDTLPSFANLIRVVQATASPATPFCVLRIPD